ncbi:MAG TPA: hypothetical protein VM778_04950 [Gemmatimonadota bacterium]|nr:hypothetical protein [Gemmatimonadota bacterium]
MRRAGLVLLAAAALVACHAIVPAGGPRQEWRQAVDLRLGERAIFDGGALEVTLEEVGVNEVELRVQSSGIPRRVRVRTGVGGAETFHPYRVALLSTSIADTATIEVTKLR